MKVACAQMRANCSVDDNFKQIETLTYEAHDAGCRLILLPENCLLMADEAQIAKIAEVYQSGPLQERFSDLAKRTQMVVCVGSMPLKASNGKVHASCLVFETNGQAIARYDKIHLFEAHLSSGEYYRESDSYEPGSAAVVARSSAAELGLSICFDVRFPLLYQRLRSAGARIILLPAAFAYTTGKVHWETLLRTRAIENQLWLLAAAQQGRHQCGRTTYGDSMIISPWGEILERKKRGLGLIIADLNLKYIEECHMRLPTLFKENPYEIQEYKA